MEKKLDQANLDWYFKHFPMQRIEPGLRLLTQRASNMIKFICQFRYFMEFQWYFGYINAIRSDGEVGVSGVSVLTIFLVSTWSVEYRWLFH